MKAGANVQTISMEEEAHSFEIDSTERPKPTDRGSWDRKDTTNLIR